MTVTKVKNMIEVSGNDFWYWLPANQNGLKLMHELTGSTDYDHMFDKPKKVIVKIKRG